MRKIFVSILIFILLAVVVSAAGPLTILGPHYATAGDNLVCGILADETIDPATITFVFNRTSAGQEYASVVSEVACSAVNCQRGDTYECALKVSGVVVNVSNEITINNWKPDSFVINISDVEPTTYEDIVCRIQTPSLENEGELLTYNFTWYEKRIVGADWEEFDSSLTVSSASTLTVPNANTSFGQMWKCEVFVSDGIDSVYAKSGTAIVHEDSPRAATNSSQWFVPFGRYDATVIETADTGRDYHLMAIMSVLNNTDFSVIHEAECDYGECGDTVVTLYNATTAVPEISLGGVKSYGWIDDIPAGIWTYSFNPQNSVQYFPLRSNDSFFHSPYHSYPFMVKDFKNGRCLGGMGKDPAKNDTCRASWIMNMKGAVGSSADLWSQWCSQEYSYEVPCKSTGDIVVQTYMQSIECENVTGIYLYPSNVNWELDKMYNMTVYARQRDGTSIDVGDNATLESLNPDILLQNTTNHTEFHSISVDSAIIIGRYCGYGNVSTVNVTGDIFEWITRDCNRMTWEPWIKNHWNGTFDGLVVNSVNNHFIEDTHELISNIIGTNGNIPEGYPLLKPYVTNVFVPSNYNGGGVFGKVKQLWGHEGMVIDRSGGDVPGFFACTPDDTDKAFCRLFADCGGVGCCVYENSCYADGYTFDIDSDNVTEICVVNSPGKWVEPFSGSTNDCGDTMNYTCSQDGDLYDVLKYDYLNSTPADSSSLFCVPQYNITGDGKTYYNWSNHTGPIISYHTYQDLSWVKETCGDNFDNDCDAFSQFTETANVYDYTKYSVLTDEYDVYPDVDAFDPDCFGNLTIRVIDADTLENISGAIIEISITNQYHTDEMFENRTSDVNGISEFMLIPATTYKIIAYADNYATGTVHQKIEYVDNTEIVISLQGSPCLSDCSRQDNPSWCDKTCDGVNGCLFDQSVILNMSEYLDGVPVGATERFLYSDDSYNYTVTACEGSAVLYNLTEEVEADIKCDGHVALVDLITNYEGTGAKVVLVTCKKDE
jgi:hypothetical protein